MLLEFTGVRCLSKPLPPPSVLPLLIPLFTIQSKVLHSVFPLDQSLRNNFSGPARDLGGVSHILHSFQIYF